MADNITKNIIIKGNASEVFQLWANFENFPHFMKNIKSVKKVSEKVSHWVMEGPLGKDLEWDAQITDFTENKRIAWNSINGDIKTSGQVTFNGINSDETEVTVMMHYVPPAGKIGEAVAKLFDNPDKKLEEDLKRFKKFAENTANI
jgi:uncharacterized membrane protein